MRPHRWQPTRLPQPWDSPGKNTGVGCHFLLQCRKVKSESEVAQSCPTLRDPMDCRLQGSSIHGIFQARVLEWGAIAFSVRNGYLYVKCFPRTLFGKGFCLFSSPLDQCPKFLIQCCRSCVKWGLMRETVSFFKSEIVHWYRNRLLDHPGQLN